MPRLFAGLLAIACLFGCASAAQADDWEVVKLRGTVLQLIDGAWQPLERGDIVPDSRVLRTLSFGRAELTRGGETVTLGPNTQIQIYDEHRARPFTTVVQSFGSVAVEANVENVQHFAVQTPYLAAVVKGTRFVVTSGKTGASVQVERGHVAVTGAARHEHVLIAAGQSAKIDSDAANEIIVAGAGELPEVVEAPIASTAPSNGKSSKGDSGDDKVKPDKGKAGNGKVNSGKGSNDEASDDEDNGSDEGNSGNGNSGNGNSGNGNPGNGNSGNGNSGNGNSGNGNPGDGNSGPGGSGGD